MPQRLKDKNGCWSWAFALCDHLAFTPRLTDRELEVLRPVAKGHNNRDIAKELYISENTVGNHIRNILEKLHLHSRMEAVVYAVRQKLLDPREVT